MKNKDLRDQVKQSQMLGEKERSEVFMHLFFYFFLFLN